jgi:hypothetical protein
LYPIILDNFIYIEEMEDGERLCSAGATPIREVMFTIYYVDAMLTINIF